MGPLVRKSNSRWSARAPGRACIETRGAARRAPGCPRELPAVLESRHADGATQLSTGLGSERAAIETVSSRPFSRTPLVRAIQDDSRHDETAFRVVRETRLLQRPHDTGPLLVRRGGTTPQAPPWRSIDRRMVRR